MSGGVPGPGPAIRTRAAWPLRLGGQCAVVLVLLLPALVAGVQLAAPALPDEVARVSAALGGGTGANPDSAIVRQFYVSALADVALPADAASLQALVARARLAQIAALLGIGLLTYLTTMLARGRLQALVATAALALLPPVLAEGYVLRPETPAVLFALLSVLLFQCFAQPVDARRAATMRAQWSWLLLGLVAMGTAGIAIVTLPAIGAPLLVPGVVLTVSAAQLALRSLRILRSRGQRALPVRSLNQRLLPWTITALMLPALTWGMLSASIAPGGTAPLTASAVGLWPAGFPGALVLALAALGALAAVLRVGARLRRHGRIGPDLVLFAACAVVLAGAAGRDPHHDTLPLAPAFALVLSEGAWALCMLLAWAGGGAATRARP